jgi:hypothetical protein
LSDTFLILRRIRRHITIKVRSSSRKVPVILVIYKKTNFLDRFSKNNQISNPTKIGPVGTELFHAEDRRTDMSKLTVEIRSFAKVRNNEISLRGIFVFHTVLPIQSEKLCEKVKEDTRIWNRSIRKRS